MENGVNSLLKINTRDDRSGGMSKINSGTLSIAARSDSKSRRSQKSRASSKQKSKVNKVPWKTIGDYIHQDSRDVRSKREIENAKLRKLREEKKAQMNKEDNVRSSRDLSLKKLSSQTIPEIVVEGTKKIQLFSSIKLDQDSKNSNKKLNMLNFEKLKEKMKGLRSQAKTLMKLDNWSSKFKSKQSLPTNHFRDQKRFLNNSMNYPVPKSLKMNGGKYHSNFKIFEQEEDKFLDQEIAPSFIRNRNRSHIKERKPRVFDHPSEISLQNVFENLVKTKSKAKSVSRTSPEPADSSNKENMKKYSRMMKIVEMMVSKRVFSLKEAKKSLKNHIKDRNGGVNESITEIKSELLFLETVLNHIRNKSLHMITFEEFLHFKSREMQQIYESCKKLYEFSRKHIVHQMAKPVTTIGELLHEESEDKPSNRTLKLILENKVLPCLFSDARLKALKEIEKKNKSRFKMTKTSPKEFNFNLFLRDKLKKEKESERSGSNEREQSKSHLNSPSKYSKIEESMLEDQFDIYQADILPKIN